MKRPRAWRNERRGGASSQADKRGAMSHGPLGPWVNPPLITRWLKTPSIRSRFPTIFSPSSVDSFPFSTLSFNYICLTTSKKISSLPSGLPLIHSPSYIMPETWIILPSPLKTSSRHWPWDDKNYLQGEDSLLVSLIFKKSRGEKKGRVNNHLRDMEKFSVKRTTVTS